MKMTLNLPGAASNCICFQVLGVTGLTGRLEVAGRWAMPPSLQSNGTLG